MRVTDLIDQLKAMPENMEGLNSEGELVVLNTHKVAESLNKSLRNCDIGTFDEQSDRFEKFCYSYNCCSKCPVKSIFDSSNRKKKLCEITRCEIIWAKLPYNEPK